MQDDENGQKIDGVTISCLPFLPSRTCIIIRQEPNLTADGNTMLNLPWYPRKIVSFLLVHSPST
jgi:hypothetical protein